MKSILFNSRKTDEDKTVSSSNTARVSWSKTVQKESRPSSSPITPVILSKPAPSSLGILSDSVPTRRKFNTIHNPMDQRKIQDKNKANRSKINHYQSPDKNTIQYIFPKKKLEDGHEKSPSVKSTNLKITSTNSFSSSWKLPAVRKNDQSKSSLSSTATDMEWDTVSSSLYETTSDSKRLSLSNQKTMLDKKLLRLSIDSSIDFLDRILEKKNVNGKDKKDNDDEDNEDDNDDDDTVLVETQSEPYMQRSAFDQLYFYQINRLKQDRNYIQQRCETLQTKYNKIKLKASFLQNVNESLDANTTPIQQHVLDAHKSGDDIEQFLQGKQRVDPDDTVSEMTMDTILYYQK